MTTMADYISDERWDTVGVISDTDVNKLKVVYTIGLTALGRPELLMVDVPGGHLVVAQATLTFVGRLSIPNTLVGGRDYLAGADSLLVRAHTADPWDPEAYLGFAIARFGPKVRAMRLEPVYSSAEGGNP